MGLLAMKPVWWRNAAAWAGLAAWMSGVLGAGAADARAPVPAHGMKAALHAATRQKKAIPAATVTVWTKRTIGVLPATAWGMNTAVWDGDLLDSAVPGLLKNMGVRMLRFPGGSEADAYHWQDGSISLGGGNFAVYPEDTFDNFMTVARKAGAQPIITVNYGSNRDGSDGGDPKEAAAWVKYANVTKKYHVQYWEIGNENYGSWEVDRHKEKGPAAYAKNALTFIQDMKAVDPTIRVGVVLTCPGDGQDPNWNPTVLKIAGGKADFVIVHWYPFALPGSASDILAATDRIPWIVSQLKQQIRDYAGPAGKHLQILVTETNSVANSPNELSVGMVNAVFLANDFTGWLEGGVANVDWWDLHNYGSSSGDYGVLANVTEEPYPTYYALVLLNRFERPGDTMVRAQSTQPADITAHAVVRKDGKTAVLFTNRSATRTYQVKVRLDAGGFQGAATVDQYGGQASTITTRSQAVAKDGTITITLPPYTIAVVAAPVHASS